VARRHFQRAAQRRLGLTKAAHAQEHVAQVVPAVREARVGLVRVRVTARVTVRVTVRVRARVRVGLTRAGVRRQAAGWAAGRQAGCAPACLAPLLLASGAGASTHLHRLAVRRDRGGELPLRRQHAANVVVHARLVSRLQLERRAVCQEQQRGAAMWQGRGELQRGSEGCTPLSIYGAGGGARTRGECVRRRAERLMQRAEVEVRLRVGRSARKLWRTRRG
jgi:hypothetical protein